MERSSRITKPLAFAVAGFVALAPAGCIVVHDSSSYAPASFSYTQHRAIDLSVRFEGETPDGAAGSWSGHGAWTSEADIWDEVAHAHIRLSFERENGLSVHTFPIGASVRGLPLAPTDDPTQPVHFEIRRNGGVLAFEGQRRGRVAFGDVRLSFEPEFVKAARAAISPAPSPVELASLWFLGVNADLFQAIAATGRTASVEDISHAVTAGLGAEDVAAFAYAAPEFNLRDLVRLRQAGISPTYVRTARASGLASATAADLARLRAQGVYESYLADMHATGRAFSPDELIRLRQSGVSAEFVRDFIDAGYELRTEQLIKLRYAGVDPDVASEAKAIGYDFSVDDLVRLRHASVGLTYLRELVLPGVPNLTAKQIIDARNRGLSAGYINSLRNAPATTAD